MLTLGINYGSSHDSAAAIAKDGELLFAIAEERLSRKKHDGRFPRLAIEACLRHVNARASDLDDVVFGWQRPSALMATDLKNYFSGAHPMSLGSAIRGLCLGSIDNYRLDGERIFRRNFGLTRNGLRRVDHHYAHALSVYPLSGFEEATVVVVDGRGAWEATSVWHGQKGKLELIETVRWPNSIGLFYAQFTAYLGFEKFQDEWKVMGLAAYGRKRIDLGDFISIGDAGYVVNSRAFLNNQENGEFGEIEAKLGPRRMPDEKIEDRHRDIAWAVQDACERAIITVVAHAIRRTGSRNLCLAGGVALNSKANGLVATNGLVDRIFIQPAASDDGVAVGAALAAPFGVELRRAEMTKIYLGPRWTTEEIEATLRSYKLPFETLVDPAEVGAELLASGKLLGWYQDRAEFGPRALGNRSILADPRDPANRDKINGAVKFREAWRPFAPSVLDEAGPMFFDSYCSTPFMTLTFRVKPMRKHEIAAVVHADGTSRVQSVTREQNERYYDLIKRFASKTGTPVLLNTSFNLRSEAIVNSPFDAIRTFYTCGLDALILDKFLLSKEGATSLPS
jgi:carbamoyltransferase